MTPRRSIPLLRLFFWLLILAAVAAAVWTLWEPSTQAPTATEPPPDTLQLSVSEGEIVSEPELTLAGRAGLAEQILINGQTIPLGPNGEFDLTLRLVEGPNLIVVETIDAAGGRTSLTRQVVYVPPGQEPPPSPASGPFSPNSVLLLALGVLAAAVLTALLRRRRPWIQVSTDLPDLTPGRKGEGPTITFIVELDRTTRLSVYLLNAGGSRIATVLNNRRRKAGRHTFTFDGYVAGELVSAGKYAVIGIAGVPLFRAQSRVEFQVRPNLRLT